MRHRSHHTHHAWHLVQRTSSSQEGPSDFLNGAELPATLLEGAAAAKLVPRTPQGSSDDRSKGSSTSSASSETTSCQPGDKSARCEKPIGARNMTLPIVLGIVIPLVIAIVVFVVLHRRHLRRLRKEDANDKHKSLDFGMDDTLDRAFDGKGRKKRGGPEMTNAHAKGAGAAHTRGLSLDLGSPYVLPPGLHGSRESLHSLSRTINQQDDRYRPATTFLGNDGTSMRSYPAGREPDEASSFAGSMAAGRDGMDQGLLKNAAKTSRTTPPPPSLPVLESVGGLEYSPPRSSAQPTVPPARKDSLPAPPQVHLAPSSAGGNEPRDSYVDRDMRRSNNYLGALINAAEPASSGKQEARGQTTQRSTLQSELSEPSRDDPSSFGRVAGGSTRPHHVEPPRSMIASVVNSSASTDLSDEVSRIDDEGHPGRIPPRQSSKQAAEKFTIPSITIPESSAEDSGVGAMGYDVRRLSVGLRPLPPEDATDNPEQRANRIRSFYKEYFEESKAGPPREVPAYYEDYDQAYQGGATYHDVDRREFVTSRAPYAQPVTRRAMTPPPRAPPRQRGGHFPQFSMSGVPSPGPRAFSSASGQYGNGPMARGRAPQRRPAPPPAPLRMLPTPHLMTEDSFAAPIDFAPPSSYKERQAGRPESPLGGLRPFSPSLPAHVPLASSFDDLSVMPSPHALRKSGTFTALDFAPSPRFKNSDAGGSDSGSIRSGRTGGTAMSAAQLHSMRAGAYRVSRLPKEVVGTKGEIAVSLKPTWDLKTDVL